MNPHTDLEPVLTDKERIEVCKQLAEFKSPIEVQKFISDEFGKDISLNGIKHYLKAKKWGRMIDRFRQEFVAPIMSIPVSHKFIRLKRLEGLYQATSGSGALKECITVLRDARAEIEGSKGNQSGNLFLTQINMLSDDQLKEKHQEVMKRIRDIEVDAEPVRKVQEEA
jgi:hypothetical protein